MKLKRALFWVAFWATLSLLFNVVVFFWKGQQAAVEYLGGYVIELTLSLDNLFLFLVIFTAFRLPAEQQRRVLNYGVAGAVVLRLLFVMLGAALVTRIHWLLYVFGAILLVSGISMLVKGEKEPDYANHPVLRLFGRVFPFTGTLEGERFFVKRDGKWYATLLFAILVLVEASDILFAIDSIPAIFSITTDTFIVFTSNIFAILGLRSLYFVLEKLTKLFRFVKVGVSLILMFTGVKLLLTIVHVEIPILLSIGVIAAILLGSIVVSALLKPGKEPIEHGSLPVNAPEPDVE